VLGSWIERGLRIFEHWGIARPVAMRTGNLRVDQQVYRAMSRMQMKVGSNIGRGMFEPTERALQLNGGVHRIEGIIELPVLTYVGLKVGTRKQLKSLTITGSSCDEMIYLLRRAHAAQCPAVVLLTHCHEFARGNPRAGMRANRATQARLRKLCRFLADEADRFDVTTMSAIANTVDALGKRAPHGDALFEVPMVLALRRIVENKLIDYNVH
jgi:hypothetical protein